MTALKQIIDFPIQQQINFVHDLRESFDNNQRELALSKRTPEEIAQLLQRIEDNLEYVRIQQLNVQRSQFCDNCNQPIVKPSALINEALCDRCAQIKIERLHHSPNGTL